MQDPTIETFGSLPSGEVVHLFTLDSGTGCSVRLSEFGAAITSIITPDRNGNPGEICLGYNDLSGYVADTKQMGVTVGRYANRIEGAKFTIKGQQYQLDENASPHHIHGGRNGFGKKLFKGQVNRDDNSSSVVFKYTSPDGDNGYPGDLSVTVTYTLRHNSLTVEYLATSSADTYVNLTNHCYFNLSGEKTILDHEIAIHSDQYASVREDLIPTGWKSPVKGSAFDLRIPTKIGPRLENFAAKLAIMKGFDVNYILGENDKKLRSAAKLCDPKSGRTLTVKTTQPCLQFYTGNHLAGAKARDGSSIEQYGALCLEAQDYPNGPNTPSFSVSPLQVGEEYRQHIEFYFGQQ